MKLSRTIFGLCGLLLVADALSLDLPAKYHVADLEPEDVQDDLDDFLYLIPLRKIEDLFYEYVAEDEDVAVALDYALSDEFKDLVTEIESYAELKSFLSYLQRAGLDAYGFVNKINGQLGVEEIEPMVASAPAQARISGGLSGLVEDVAALLPIDDIVKLYRKKLDSSKAFAGLVEELRSTEFQALVDKLAANSKLQRLVGKLEAKGVDVRAALDFISRHFGVKFPTRPVRFSTANEDEEKEEEVIDILRVIWSKIPMNKLFDLIFDYLINDSEFQDVVQYMLSEDFRKIQLDIESLPEMKALARYLESVGMKIYDWLNIIHELVGMPPIEHRRLSGTDRKITGKLPGLVKDIRELLPTEELYEYFEEKMRTSSKFRAFIERLEKKELQEAVNALHKHEGYNDWLRRLQAKGVDLDELVQLIEAIIGIKFPPRKP